MWIFLNDAFLSIVAHRVAGKTTSKLVVRARRRGDLARVFPKHAEAILHTPQADYGFRLYLPHAVVAAAVLRRLLMIEYGNFKAGVEEDDRHNAYTAVWETMFLFQGGRMVPELRRQSILAPGLFEFEDDEDEGKGEEGK